MFERFSEPSKAVLVEAQDVAIELASPSLGPGHLLYGCAEGREETAGKLLHDAGITGALVRKGLPRTSEASSGSVDPEALRAIGIDYDGIRGAVEQTFGPGALESAPDRRGAPRGARPRFTKEAKKSLELALRVAVALDHKRIQPGHLLLGLIRVEDDFIMATIEQSGTTVAALSTDILSQLSAA